MVRCMKQSNVRFNARNRSLIHPSGAPGKQGPRGPRGVQGIKGGSAGTVYTRWGRSDCPKSAQMLYSGK